MGNNMYSLARVYEGMSNMTKRKPKVSKAEEAIEKADPLLLGTALINGADPNQRLNRGETLLHRACATDVPVLVTMLLEKGANVNARNNRGETPAYIAAENGHAGTLIVLGRFGADFNIASKEGESHNQRSARMGDSSD